MGPSQTRARSGRRRNRRADQFCVHVVADERQIPVYAVEFKAPHKLTVAELVAGLHEMDLARDVIDQEGDTSPIPLALLPLLSLRYSHTCMTWEYRMDVSGQGRHLFFYIFQKIPQ